MVAAVCLVANYGATGPYVANPGRLGPHRNPEEHPERYYKWNLKHSAHGPATGTSRGELCPYPTLTGRCACVGDLRLVGLLPSPVRYKHAHARARQHPRGAP